MGNNKSKNNDNYFKLKTFHKEIMNNLKKKYKVESLDSNIIDLIFKNNNFSKNYLKNWILKFHKKEKISMLLALEILFLESKNRFLIKYKCYLTQLDILILICLDLKPDNFPNKINFNSIKIIIKFITNIFINDEEDDTDIINSLNSTFLLLFSSNDENEFINFSVFKEKFYEIFNNIYYINIIFYDLFFGFDKSQIFPSFSSNYILNNQILYILCLNNSKICNNIKINRIYHCNDKNYSIINLSNKILNIGNPLLILIKNEYFYDKKLNYEVFGIYVNCKFKHSTKFYGDEECYLFSILPNTNFFNKKLENSDNKYIYLSFLGYNKGLAFGYNSKLKKSRLWIDVKLEKSYCWDNGDIYKNGSISNSVDDYLKIKEIEIWSLDSNKAISSLFDKQSRLFLNNK